MTSPRLMVNCVPLTVNVILSGIWLSGVPLAEVQYYLYFHLSPLSAHASAQRVGPPIVCLVSCGLEEIAVTVIHEVAHHFGIDDEILHQLGWG